ncbi:MAG: hypothetical protein RDV48_17610 [Candidatus Eremiobacteraeota bacterium]|nr:hypothetical protein [Candidatus Eremiobacteraeota bacterium]
MGEQLTYNWIVVKGQRGYTAHCPEFMISVDAESSQTAKKELAKEVAEFLREALKDRQFLSIVEDGGFTKSDSGWLPPRMEESGTEKLEL